ncbi:hypothetical protein [Cylindrospermopsis raciborskii]|nr:hypothetical protein [Cylindrospermopsis raciborskii]
MNKLSIGETNTANIVKKVVRSQTYPRKCDRILLLPGENLGSELI